MNFFKKFLRLFSKKQSTVPKKSAKTTEMLFNMPHNVVHPSQLLEPLCMAVAMKTLKPMAGSIQDICLYSVYENEGGEFLGSFYGIKKDDMYYGNIVGSSQIFCCPKDAFRFVKTKDLAVPLKNEGSSLVILMCEYDCRTTKLTAKYLKRTNINLQDEEILHAFENGTSFEVAYDFWKNQSI